MTTPAMAVAIRRLLSDSWPAVWPVSATSGDTRLAWRAGLSTETRVTTVPTRVARANEVQEMVR